MNMTQSERYALAHLARSIYEVSDCINERTAAFYRKFHKLGWVSRIKWDRPRAVCWKITDKGRVALRSYH